MIRMTLSRAATAIDARYEGNDVEFVGCSTDSRNLEKDNLFIALQGEHFNGHDYVGKAEEQGASSLMLHQDVEHQLPVIKVKDTRKAMGLLARAWREELAVPLVAITGSNGKTTVKEMVKTILSEIADVHATEANLNNDIGVPLTLFGLNEKHRYAVVEMGANHPGEIAWLSSIAHPNVAVITQCAPAHLEGFGSVEGVAHAKAEIFSGLGTTGTAIINADDEYASYWQGVSAKNKQYSFAIDNSYADVRGKDICLNIKNGTTDFVLLTANNETLIQLPLLGRHNVMNALAAAACCLSLGIETGSIKSGLEKMKAVKGRLQVKKGQLGISIIDDTYNANPTSLAAAIHVLAACPGKRLLVLGDMGELGNAAAQLHKEAGTTAKDAGVDGLFTLGELSRHASQSFGAGAQHAKSMDELSQELKDCIESNTTVLVKGSRTMQMERVVAALQENQ